MSNTEATQCCTSWHHIQYLYCQQWCGSTLPRGHTVVFPRQQWSYKYGTILHYMYFPCCFYCSFMCIILPFLYSVDMKTWIVYVLSGSGAVFSSVLSCVMCALVTCVWVHIFYGQQPLWTEESQSHRWLRALVCYFYIMSASVLYQFDVFQQKEPEYTKVRRKGGKLRDPHSESQGTVI